LAEEEAPFVARTLGVELAWWRPVASGQGRTAFGETKDGRQVVIKVRAVIPEVVRTTGL
jgi:hypothetical protein